MADLTIAEALAQCESGPSTSVYAHPYYQDRKGKGRALDARLNRIREVKQALLSAQRVLEGREGDWNALSRSLKDIAGHSQTLIPLTSSIPRPTTDRPSIPSRQILLSPAELLTALCASLGIEVYAEDSQFGLLKQTLALAGNCFVIDIEIEQDAVPEEGADKQEDGRARLSKLEVHHVTESGGNAQSMHVQTVLEELVIGYIEAKYTVAEGYVAENNRAKLVQDRIDGLREALRQVKELDGRPKGSLFAKLEEGAKRVQALVADNSVLQNSAVSILPSFRMRSTSAPISLRPLADSWELQFDTIPVRRDWLNSRPAADPYDGGVKVENLWYQASDSDSDINPFPYDATFTHRPSDSVQQSWHLAQPGPDGYLVNHISLKSLDDLLPMLEALRCQVVLNDLVSGVFSPNAIEPIAEEEEDLDDLLNGPVSIPIDVYLGASLEILFPLPHTKIPHRCSLTISFTGKVPPIACSASLDPPDEAMSKILDEALDQMMNQQQDPLTLPDMIASLEAALRS